jgi:ketosteroid isomerase-like protein
MRGVTNERIIMTYSITRFVLVGFAAFLASLILVIPTVGYAVQRTDDEAKKLAEVYDRANAALLRGDVGTWARLVPMAKDFVLMSPFGGEPSRYADYGPERLERMGKFFRNGRFRQEVVAAYPSRDMIVLVTIERANVEVGGLPAQDWALRVTSVFTRDGSHWLLAHRHADPLVADVSLKQSALLGRGERMTAEK